MPTPITIPPFTLDPNNTPGPIQAKRLRKAVDALRRLARTKGERLGRADEEGTVYFVSELFGVTTHNPRALELLQGVAEKYPTITKDNAAAVLADVEAVTPEARAAVPIEDKREAVDAVDVAEERAQKMAKQTAERARVAAEKDAAYAAIRAKIPKVATALIVAEFDEDESDMMTDYFSSKTTRAVIIGWRKGTREDFRALRRAAASFEPTAHLGPDAPDSIEHRENWSMGAGNYLKDGSRYSTGWTVRSRGIGYGWQGPTPEDGLPAAPAAMTAPGDAAAGIGWNVLDATNKRGPFALVVPGERMESDLFTAVYSLARDAGGWYSRAWEGQPGGFGFATRELAEGWVASMDGGAS